jgi:hypothetical protein
VLLQTLLLLLLVLLPPSGLLQRCGVNVLFIVLSPELLLKQDV